jgi:hypothetical protein
MNGRKAILKIPSKVVTVFYRRTPTLHNKRKPTRNGVIRAILRANA